MLKSRRILLVAALFAVLAHPSVCSNQRDGAHTVQADGQLNAVAATAVNADSSLTPPVWPEQFKSVMFQNRTNK
jgi:hypothetical protein